MSIPPTNTGSWETLFKGWSLVLGSCGEDEARGSSVYVAMGLGQVQGDHSRGMDLQHEESQHLMSDQGETFYAWLKDGAGDVSFSGEGDMGVDLEGLEGHRPEHRMGIQ